MTFCNLSPRWTPSSVCLILTLGLFTSAATNAQEPTLARRVSDDQQGSGTTLTSSDTTEPIVLRHKFTVGEIVEWKIEHTATTETNIQGNKQDSRMKSVSTRRWEVTEVSDNGRITFVQSVEDVSMASKLSDRPEIRFDSRSGKNPPPEYSGVPATIGVPLATFTVEPQGKVVERLSDIPPQDLGLGDIVMPFPEQALTVGDAWDSERDLTARSKEGQRILIKSRQRYCLRRVNLGIAYISVDTQIMTPDITPRIESQIMQQMTKGTIMFDIEAGRIWKQEIEWDEQVIGFDSADSLMKYNALYVQELMQPEDESAKTSFAAPISNIAASAHTASEAIRLRDDKPLIRR